MKDSSDRGPQPGSQRTDANHTSLKRSEKMGRKTWRIIKKASTLIRRRYTSNLRIKNYLRWNIKDQRFIIKKPITLPLLIKRYDHQYR